MHRLAAAISVALFLLLAIASHASATSHRTGPKHAAAVDWGKISSDLKRETGYAASQLTAQPVCGAPQPERFSCFAQMLAIKGTGRAAPVLRVQHASPMHTTRGNSASAAIRSADVGSTAPSSGTAAFLQWAYDTTWLSANRGAGDTVAIIDAYDDPSAYTDMNQFRMINGLAALPTCSGGSQTTCFQEVNQNGASSPLPRQSNDETNKWNIEESLDLDAVSALCPLCKILLVESSSDDYHGNPDMERAAATAATLGAKQISMSFGGDLTGNESAEAANWSFGSAAPIAASGDKSYPGPLVTYPAALPNVTAVGGTSLSASQNARGFGESTWSIACSGSPSTCTGTESGCDTSQVTPSYQLNDAAINSACAATAAAIGQTYRGGRAYNDISADANPDTGLNIYDSQAGTQGCNALTGQLNNMCVIGGTSLATPLTAAYEAITSVSGASPSWTYQGASLLNDVVAGSDANTCPLGALLICTAGTGWDGPTGNGSINGDIVVGGPGVGGSYASYENADDVALAAGVYPNGGATSYSVQYWLDGSDPSTGTTSASTSIGTGSGLQSIATTLCGLQPSTKYDFSVIATNPSGSEDGYEGSFTTTGAEVPPSATSLPSITGATNPGQTLSAQPGAWNEVSSPSCGSDYLTSYQWQESASPNGPWTSVSSASNYPLAGSDMEKYLRVAVTETNSVGSATADSAAVGPVTDPVTTTTTTVLATTKPSTKITTVRFYRCNRSCTLLSTHGAATYKPQRADYGRYIKQVTTVSLSGTAPKVTTRWIGPITAPTAGVLTVKGTVRVASALVIKGTRRAKLARVRVMRRTKTAMTLVITPLSKATTSAWGYVINDKGEVTGTATHRVGKSLRLTVQCKAGQTLKLVAERT